MKINELIKILDTVEDALLHAQEFNTCPVSARKSQYAINLVREARSNAPSHDDLAMIEIVCSELPSIVDENILAYENSVKELSQIQSQIDSRTVLLNEVNSAIEYVKNEYQLSEPELEVLVSEAQADAAMVMDNQQLTTSVELPAVELNYPTQPTVGQRDDLIDYDDFQPIPAYKEPVVEVKPSICISIEKHRLQKGYLKALRALGRNDSTSIHDSSVFIDNFSFYINSQFSPSMSIESAIKTFASSGDALKVFGHKKVEGQLEWHIPRSYVEGCVAREGFTVEYDTLDRLEKQIAKIFEFPLKASTLLSESIAILDNDSVVDMLAGFD
ncbi:hypothetical protein LMH73_004540 [Vibrio splendidus]|nr:hypothetical protein [Vibrio splendidus]MCC4883298.1 hypothetical protein [Vibrio splendidus]